MNRKPAWVLAALMVVQASHVLANDRGDEIYFNPALGMLFDQIEAYEAFDLKKMNKLGANYESTTTDLIEKQASVFSRLLSGSIPSFTCQTIDSEPTLIINTTLPDIDKSNDGISTKWASLVDSDFVMASLLTDVEVLKKAVQHRKNTLARRNSSCTALAAAAQALACYQGQKDGCHERYFEERKALEAFELPTFGNEVKSLFSDLKPFLALAGEERIRQLIDSGKSYEDVVLSLNEALKSALEDSIDDYQQWYSSEQITLLLAEQGDWLQDFLGLNDQQKRLIKQLTTRNDDLDEAMLDYLRGQYSAANERLVEQQSVRALSEYYDEKRNAYVALKESVLAKIQALKTDGSILLSQSVAAIGDAETDVKAQLDVFETASPKEMFSNVNETFKIYVDLTPNGSLTGKGRPLNKARLFLFSTAHQQLMSIPGCLSGVDCKNGDIKANPLINCKEQDRSKCSLSSEAGENIDLGISVDNILQEPDGTYSFYCPAGASCISVQGTISREKMAHILEAMGISPIVPITKNAKIIVDRHLRNLSYEIDFNPFGNLVDAPPVTITLIKDGSVVEPKLIALAIANHVKEHVIRGGLIEWLLNMPFVQKADQQLDSLFALLTVDTRNASIEYICKAGDSTTSKKYPICSADNSDIPKAFRVTASFKLGSVDAELQNYFGDASYPIEVIVNQSGAYINAQSVPKDLYVKLQFAASKYVSKLLKPLKASTDSDLVSLSVNPVIESRFNKSELAFWVSYSISAGGCESDSQEIRLIAPFPDIDAQIESIFKNAEQIVAKCIKDGLIRKATAAIKNQEITLFGITAKLDGAPSFNENLGATTISIALDDPLSDTAVVLKGLTANNAGDGRYEIDFRTIDWSHNNASQKVGAIIEHRVSSIFGADSTHFTMKDAELSRDGFSFELLIHDIPYIGNFSLGRIYLNALTDRKIIDIMKEALKPRLEQVVNHALKEKVEIPDLGPVADIEPTIHFNGDYLELGASAKLQLYGGISAPIEIEMFPLQKVHVPNGEQVATTALTSLLTDTIPLQAGPLKFTPAPTQVTYFPNIGAYGLPFGFKIDVGIIKVEVLDIKITPKKLHLPDSISAQLDSIPLPPYAVIADPGFTYYLKTKGLTIDGAITIVDRSFANVVNIDAKIGLVDLDALKFELAGKLIAASSLPLYEAKGAITLKDALIEYDAGTTKLLKPILESRGRGYLDGKNLKASNASEIRILGAHISDNDFTLTVPPSKNIEDGKFSYGGSQTVLIGTLSYSLESDLRLKEPKGTASANIDLGDWSPMSGSLFLDLYRAKLDFNALGINIKVIAPSIKGITPRVLLRILADLLKVDIKSLLKMKLDEIVINLMDANGKVDEERSKAPKCERPDCGPPPPELDPNPTPLPTPTPVPPPEPCKEGCDRDPIVEEEPLVDGYYACYEHIHGRYEFEREYGVRVKYDPGHRHEGTLQEIRDWHPVTFGQSEATDLCSNNILKETWKPVAARQTIHYLQYQDYACDSENRLNIGVSPRDKATWNEYGHGYFCGSVTNDKVPGYKQIQTLEGETISYEEWLTVKKGEDEFSQLKYNLKLEELYAKHEGPLKEVGKPILNHPETMLNFEQDGFFCWRCKRRVSLRIYSEPKSDVHHWKQAFHLFYKGGEFWYLSMCEDANLMKNYVNTKDPIYKTLCRTSLSKFDTQLNDLGPRVAGLQNEFKSGRVWLEPDEYYFLLEKRAVPHFLTGNVGTAEFDRSFRIIKDGKQYTVQKISLGQGENQPIEFFIFSKEPGTETHKIIIESDDPLHKWMDHTYSEEILKMLMDYEILRVIYEDIEADKLVLIDERSVAGRNQSHASTRWFSMIHSGGQRKPADPRDVLIDRQNPYSQRPLQAGEYQNVIGRYYTEVIEKKWTHIDFGLDAIGSYEITALSNNDKISVLINKVSLDGLVGDTAVTDQRQWNNDIDALKKNVCFGTRDRNQLVAIVTKPSSYFPSEYDEHPFSKLAQSRCR